MTQAYPLTWPESYPRTTKPQQSRFKTTINGALKNVQDSIRKFSDDSGRKVENVVDRKSVV